MVGSTEARNLIRRMVDKLVREYQPEKVILFGSYARGTPDPDSDVDLLIIKETSERPIDRRLAVAKIVSDPECFVPFQPLVLTPEELAERLRVGDQFVREIVQGGEVLYAS